MERVGDREGRPNPDVVTSDLEDFTVWLSNTYKPAQGIKACRPFHGAAALQLEGLLDWWGRVEQLGLSGDGQAGPIVWQQVLLRHDALYRTLPHITQEMSSCSRGPLRRTAAPGEGAGDVADRRARNGRDGRCGAGRSRPHSRMG